MNDRHERAVAIVGVGGHPARRAQTPPPSGRTSGEKRYSITRGARPTAGALPTTTIPIPPRPTRPTARSAAGCAASSSTGSASASRRAWRRPWTRASSGRSPSPPRRWPTTAIPTGRSTPSAPASSWARPWAASCTTSPRLRICFPEYARAAAKACASSQELPAGVRERDPRALARGGRAGAAADHRGHDARRAGQHRLGPRGQRAQPARPQLHHRRRLRLELRGHRRGRRAAGRGPVRRGDHRRRRPQHGRRDPSSSSARSARSRATGTRPFGDGADGFVMGEGCGRLPAQAPGRRRARRRPRSTP